MRKFFQNTKGAVTVFVTLLLIPAVLISGTAVDLARLHTARSVLQDANQLAANTVLTQYNALLYDLYGLFGVAEDDPILGKLLDDYIRVSVFGLPAQDKELGSLQLLYASDLSLDEPVFYDEMHLENEDVLRRQIEEYMKFRGPVIIVKEIIEALENNKLKADKKIVEDKTAIDAEIIALYDKYKELYDAIIISDKCALAIGGIGGGHFGTISSHLKLIREQFVNLKACYKEWEELTPPEPSDDPEDAGSYASANMEYEKEKRDYAAKYEAILGNIKALTIGGRRGTSWRNGSWRSYGTGETGLKDHIEGARQFAEDFKSNFDKVLELSRQVDAMHNELTRKIDALERKLNNGECSEELKKGLTEKYGSPPMSLIERYREILKWDDVAKMATVYRDGGYSFIDDIFKPMLDDIRYRNSGDPSAGSLTLDELANLASNPEFRMTETTPAEYSKAAYFAEFPESSVRYGVPPGFKKFSEHSAENKEFFEVLTAMVNQPKGNPVKVFDNQDESGGSNTEEKQRNMIGALLKVVDSAYIGLSNNPLGALYIADSDTAEPEKPGILDILTLIPKALGNPVISVIEDPVGSVGKVGDYVLLLTYSTSMFSNYTTTRPESLGKTKNDLSGINFPKSIAGIPISPEVNYFFQSEWEYLYHGSQNAKANLSAVSNLIFLVRMICNYITVFSVSEVTEIVTSIQAAFAWNPILGLVLGELARAAFVAAESLIDVASLRSGHRVPLFKNVAAGEWVCSPKGVIKAIKDITASETGVKAGSKEGKGLSYSNYLLFFFVSKALFYMGPEKDAASELAKFTGNLIEWNVINKISGSNANEKKMAAALEDGNRFMLSRMVTGFGLKTTANLRMLFLSLPFAQKGIAGVIPPEKMPITAIDYRGY